MGNTTTLRPLHALQYDKRGRVCNRETRVLKIDTDAWREAHEGDERAVSYANGSTSGPVFWVTTTDHETGDTVEIAVAPCGLGCRCAAAWRKA